MSRTLQNRARDERVVAVGFRGSAPVEVVVARLLEAARRTDVSLLTVFGDGDKVYPAEGQDPTRTASSWRAELAWRYLGDDPGGQLEIFLGRAELYLNPPGGLRVELGRRGRTVREGFLG
jgi:hypothetical protein